MEKIVVFVRHTEAQVTTDQKDDAKRTLTEKGKADAKKVARSIRSMLADSKLTILSSPLIRAKETAEIIAKKLEVDVVEADWIARGSLDKLQEAILSDKSDVLIVVGHEPTLSQWIDSCSHIKLPMRKGTACALLFREDVSEGADLLWYLDKKAVSWNE
jgi:phosphohistidine phosphatase SixA